MIIIDDKSKCCGCTSCYSVCPVNAISIKYDENGFPYPTVNEGKCVNCGKCEKVCPVLSVSDDILKNERIAFATRTKNEKALFDSTSGGISFELASEVIRRNGIVYGVCYTEDFTVAHCRLVSLDDLHRMQGSKYIQSDINESYKMAKKDLIDGKTVYYTGTPCQIEGLLSYLGKDYDNLVTQDTICHGVPSPGLWKRYLHEEKFENAEKIIFREKTKGWGSKSEFMVKFKDGSEKRMPFSRNDYYYYFYWNYSLRPICFNCPFKTGKKKSDVTVADLWGIENLLPDFKDDTKGMSFLSINSQKGKDLFDSIQDKVDFWPVKYEDAVAANMMMLKSVKKPEKYDDFWTDISRKKLKRVFSKYKIKDPIILRIKKKLYPIKRMLIKQ